MEAVGFHGYGWSGGFYHPHYWGGFYIGPVWYAGPTIVVAGVPYYYYSGEYYTPSGDVLVAAAPPIAEPTVVPASAPSEAASAPAKVESPAAIQLGDTVTVVVAGVPYYYYGGVYHTLYGSTLVAVAPPVIEPTVAPEPTVPTEAASAPVKIGPKATQQSGETITVNVPNVGGGHTPVKLVKTANGYLGPQGEFYAGHPTVAELKVLYGN